MFWKQDKTKKQKGLFWAGVMTVLSLMVLIALGSWQVQRLQWKTALLERIHTQMEQPPQALPETIDDLETWEYRNTSIAGKFMHDQSLKIGPRIFDGKTGNHLITVFQRASGGVVLVNRGWVPSDDDAELTKPEGIIKISGVLRRPAATNPFTPENDIEKKQWYWLDMPVIAKHFGLAQEPLPLVLYADAVSGDTNPPIGSQLRVDIPNNHLQYALFWYGMAFILCIIYTIYYRQNRKSGDSA